MPGLISTSGQEAMDGGAALVDNKIILAGIGTGILLIALYLAQQSTGDSLVGVPVAQTEAQFNTWGKDFDGGINEGTPLDLTPTIHFFDEGWACPGQQFVATQHRYPLVSGGNITTVMHRGMSSLAEQSPDNPWRVTPPSEYNL
jgi:hypothetical protein